MTVTDMFGRVFLPGDVIAYAVSLGSTPKMVLGTVVDEVTKTSSWDGSTIATIRVARLAERPWGKEGPWLKKKEDAIWGGARGKIVQLNYPDRAIIIRDPDLVARARKVAGEV